MINSALHGQFTWQVLIYLALAKLLVTLLCFSAGTPEGMFAPALFIGGIWSVADSEVLLIVGGPTRPLRRKRTCWSVWAFFAGVFRAPITSIFMVFEVSASYVIILPVMIANTTAYLLSRRLHETPFFKMLAEIEGVNLPSAEEKRNFRPLRVEDAMQPIASPMAVEPGMRLFPDEPGTQRFVCLRCGRESRL